MALRARERARLVSHHVALALVRYTCEGLDEAAPGLAGPVIDWNALVFNTHTFHNRRVSTSSESAPPRARRRRYDSPRRRELAEATRVDVVTAATRLFVDRGWSGTSMRDIAKEAGVSVETVYAAVGTKTALLKVAVDVSVVGDVEAVPLADRPEFRALGHGALRARLEGAARLLATLNARTSGLHRVLQHAAHSEPSLAMLLREVHRQERETTRLALTTILDRVPSEEQVDGLQALMSNDVYLLLTELSGWGREQYESWMADAVARLLDLEGELR